MTSRTAKRVAALGVTCYGVMWVFLLFAVRSLGEALDQAEVAIHGDITAVTASLRRSFEIAQLGLPLGLVGYVLLFVGVKQGRARAKWIYRSGLAVSVSYLLLFPIGTILGICGIIHFRRHREEYLRGEAPPALRPFQAETTTDEHG